MTKKSLEEFTYLFLATCFIQESNHLNLDVFKEYIYIQLSRDICDVPKNFALIDKKIDLIIVQMMEEGLVKKIAGFDYLVAINKNPFFSLLLEEYKQDMNKMMEIYNEYINFAFKDEREIYNILSQKEKDYPRKKLSL